VLKAGPGARESSPDRAAKGGAAVATYRRGALSGYRFLIAAPRAVG